MKWKESAMNSISTNESLSFNKTNENCDEPECQWRPWSIVRNDYRRMAWESDRSGDYDKGILYDTKALSCGFIGSLLNDDQRPIFSDNRPSANKMEDSLHTTIEMQQETKNELIDYLTECMRGVTFAKPKNKPHDDEKCQFDELRKKCGQLPEQWTVVQFSQKYSGYNGFATTKDVYTSDAPIKITLFCDSLSKKRDHRPIGIVLDWLELGEKSVSYLYGHDIKSKCSIHDHFGSVINSKFGNET